MALRPGTITRAWLLVLAVSAAMALGVPARWQGWVTPMGVLVQTLVAPVSGPVTRLARWVAPVVPPRPSDEQFAVIEQQNHELRTQLLAQIDENARLRRQLESLRLVVPSNNAVVDMLPARVLGASSDLAGQALTLRAGSRDGVTTGSVATVDFTQILGRVVSVSPRTCTVLPITARNAQDMECVVVLDDTTTVRCRLVPTGKGLLRGDLEDKRDASGAPIEPRVGAEVRLSDPSRWPADAQMLIVGVVESVEPSPRQPLRRVVAVRPTVPDLTRVGEAVLRIPSRDDTRHAGASVRDGAQGGGR